MNKPASTSAGRVLKLVKIGNSTGVVLPREVLERLGAEQGDSVNVASDEEGRLVVTRCNVEFARQLSVARAVMERRRKALRELAK